MNEAQRLQVDLQPGTTEVEHNFGTMYPYVTGWLTDDARTTVILFPQPVSRGVIEITVSKPTTVVVIA
jgi:hypothetical protein